MRWLVGLEAKDIGRRCRGKLKGRGNLAIRREAGMLGSRKEKGLGRLLFGVDSGGFRAARCNIISRLRLCRWEQTWAHVHTLIALLSSSTL